MMACTSTGSGARRSRTGAQIITRWKARFVLTALGLLLASPVGANPYLAKPGEAAQRIRVATCAISGGFMHLYTAVDPKVIHQVWPAGGIYLNQRQRHLAGGAFGP